MAEGPPRVAAALISRRSALAMQLLHCLRLAPPATAFEPGQALRLLQPLFEELVVDPAAAGGGLHGGPGPINGPNLRGHWSAGTQGGATSDRANDGWRCVLRRSRHTTSEATQEADITVQDESPTPPHRY